MSSLILAGLIELIGDTTDPWVKLVRSMGDAYTRGYSAPETSEIERMLDGERVVGGRNRNRMMTLPLRIDGESRVDVGARIDLICQIVNVAQSTLDWTPTGGLTTVHDWSWGEAIPQEIGTEEVEGLFRGGVLLHLPADAFGRSDSLQFVEVNAGALAKVDLDDMDSGTFTNLTLDTVTKYSGAGSGKGTLTKADSGLPVPLKTQVYQPPGGFGRLFPGGAEDLTGYGATGLRMRWPAPTGTWRVALKMVLWSGGVGVGVTNAVMKFPAGDKRQRLVTFPLSEAWDLTAVDEWTLFVNPGPLKYLASRPSTSNFWLDALEALPPQSATNSTSEGALMLVPNVLGSARAPVNLVFTEPA